MISLYLYRYALPAHYYIKKLTRKEWFC